MIAHHGWIVERNFEFVALSVYTHRYIYIYMTVFGNVAGKPLCGERAAGPGKLVGRKLGGQYTTRLRCITQQYNIYILAITTVTSQCHALQAIQLYMKTGYDQCRSTHTTIPMLSSTCHAESAISCRGRTRSPKSSYRCSLA